MICTKAGGRDSPVGGRHWRARHRPVPYWCILYSSPISVQCCVRWRDSACSCLARQSEHLVAVLVTIRIPTLRPAIVPIPPVSTSFHHARVLLPRHLHLTRLARQRTGGHHQQAVRPDSLTGLQRNNVSVQRGLHSKVKKGNRIHTVYPSFREACSCLLCTAPYHAECSSNEQPYGVHLAGFQRGGCYRDCSSRMGLMALIMETMKGRQS